MKNTDAYLNMLLDERSRQLRQYKEELKCMPEGYLSGRKYKGRYIYMQVFAAQGKRKRVGINKNRELVGQLARKKYLQMAIKILESSTPKLQRLVSGDETLDSAAILGKMPPVYRSLPEEMFFPAMRAASKWAAEDYEKSTYREEERRHITSRGLRVRSKSELIIAEKLDSYEIPYRYEQMIYIENYPLSPDFVIKTEDGLIYWEHCGLMGDARYRKRNKWRLELYEKAGIVPWKNLIITYDTEDGSIDMRIIESEIVNRLLV